MDPLAALAVGRAEFDRRLRLVQPADWDRSTPCYGWVVRDLVVHVLYGDRMTVEPLHGCTRDEATAVFADATIPDDPVAEFMAGPTPRPPRSRHPAHWNASVPTRPVTSPARRAGVPHR